MPDIKINKQILSFSSIIYVDANYGSDTTGNGTVSNPYKTLSNALSKVTTNNTCIYLFPGTYSQSAFGGYNISIIGSKQNTTIYSASGVSKTSGTTLTLYNLIWEYMDRFLNLTDVLVKAYNCVFKAISTSAYVYFLYGNNSNHELINCIIIKMTGSGTTAQLFIGGLTSVLLKNCYYMDLNNGTARYGGTYNVQTSLIRDSFVNSFSGSSLNQGTIASPSIDLIDYNITLESSLWKNKGIDSSGNPTNIGVYGGEFSWSGAIYKYFFFDNNQYKIYNTDTNSWSEVIITQPSDYETYGMDSIKGVDITTLEDPDTITIKKYTTKLNDESVLYVRYKQTLLFSNPIDIKNVVNFQNFEMLLMNPAQGQIKFIISFDNINWYGLNKERYVLTPVNDLTPNTQYEDVKEYGITNEDALYIDYGYDLPNIRSTSSKLYVAFYIENMDISSNIQLDSFHMICDYKQGYDAAIQTVDYIYNHTQNQTIVKLLTAGSYKINYFKKDIAMQVEENAIENSGVDSWNDLQNKPLFFTPTEHTHTIYNIDTLHNILNNKSNTIHNHAEEHTHEDYDAIEKISYVGIKPYFNGILWPGAEDRDGDSFISLHDTPNTYDDTNEEFIKSNITNIVFEPLTLSVPSTDVVVSDTKSRRYSFLFGGG